MAAAPLVVRVEDVDAQRADARANLLDAGLPQAVREAAPGAYGLTRAGLELLEALEGGVAAGRAVQAALLGRVAADRASGFAAGAPSDSERRFAAWFAALVACEEALAGTARFSGALPERPFEAEEVAGVLSAKDGFGAALCRDLRGYLDHYRTHPEPARRLGDEPRLLACARSHLRRLALAARAACGTAEHAALCEALSEATLRLPGVDYAGLERRDAGDQEEPDLLDVSLDDVVGNREFLDAGLKLARAVASFDQASGRNPRVVENPVLFALGSPGCGKTVTAHALGRYFLELCREAGLPARFRVIRRTDWASSYQNKSAGDLLRIFRDEVFGFAGVCGAYWPDIDTAFAARGDADIRAEEKSNLATLFGILDGTIGPRNGQWFLLCDANYMQMDDALASRLTQDPKLARGPENTADYVRLLRDVKLKSWRALLPPDSEWDSIGQRLCDARLSGRAVAAVAGRVAAELQDVEEPPGFFRMSFEEKKEALAAAARALPRERILEHIDHYVRFEKEAAERAHRQRFERRVEEIRLQLSAQAAAFVSGEPARGGAA